MARGLAVKRRGQKLPAEVRQRLLAAFGEELRQQRKVAGVSQDALAKLTGMHYTEIGMLERGEREPRISTCFTLTTALGVPFEQLLETAAAVFLYEQQRGGMQR